MRLLAHAPFEAAAPALGRLLWAEPRQEVRLAAVGALASHRRPEAAELLLQSWKRYTPAVRRAVTDAMLRQPERVERLLDELEAGGITGAELGADAIRRLEADGRTEVRERARKLLEAGRTEDRRQVLERYRPALAQEGDPGRGRQVFQKSCASCHRIAGVGVRVGPDISDSVVKAPQALLADILDPSRVIDSNYVNYLVTTRSGGVLTGYIASETTSSLTLRRADDQTDLVLRQDVKDIRSTGASLMPDGLEKSISIGEMADLLSFLKGWRSLDAVAPAPTP